MWPFNRRNPSSKIKYVLARSSGKVTEVRRGLVVVNKKRYEGLSATFVQPGQTVSRRQVIGKKHR